MSHTPFSLRVTIIGAGLGGLAAAIAISQCGHQVEILERTPELSELGAGVQIHPNAMRILDSWGLKEVVYEKATKNRGSTIHRYSDGRIIGRHRGEALELYQYHPLSIHRADYQRILYDEALKNGARIRFRTKVSKIDPSIPRLTLEDGSVIESDLIMGADGVGSKIRTAMFPQIQPRVTGDCAFRIILAREDMLKNPKLAHLVQEPSADVWFGPRRHVVAYTIRGIELYNVVFCGPGSASVGVWNETASLEELNKEYDDFEDTVKEIIGCADSTHKWTIAEIPDLPSWLSENGKLVLLGDAAHAMMPYAAQGAAMCIEDAAVLGACLSKATSVGDIPPLTKAYEAIRKSRAEKVKSISVGNMKLYDLPDGPEQEARDAEYMRHMLAAEEIKKTLVAPKPDQNAPYGSPGFSMWLDGHRTDEEVRKYFEKNGMSNTL